jgi:hypothetical protein
VKPTGILSQGDRLPVRLPGPYPVPEYIRLISEKRFTDAYMINWESNVFPGVLGRVCDRPCEPACRRAGWKRSRWPSAAETALRR